MSTVAVLLLTCLIAACGEKPTNLRVEFVADELPRNIKINDLRFYLHDIYLLDNGGNKTALAIDGQPVVLVDLTPNSKNNAVAGKAPAQTFNGIEFKLGVPFDLNHSDPLTAKPPLNDSTLFWTWQQGYKFLRFDFANGAEGYAFHLGSTGCESASALRPPEAPCAQPNVVTVRLTGFDPAQRAVKVNLNWIARLLEQGDGGSCTGSYSADTACTKIVDGLGLDVGTGRCINDCVAQKLFHWSL